MVAYVVLGGLIFRRLEAGHRQDVDADIGRVKDWHVSWLWNLTAEMNVLHPRNWTVAALSVLDNYTAQV